MPEPLKLQDIKLRMQAYGVRPQKKMGQNILADFNLLKAIVADAEIDQADCVLEVGTGAGSLTGYLCDAAGLVISVELDRGMFELSRDILAGVPNLVQVRCDALYTDGRGLNPELEGLLREYLQTGSLPQASPAGLPVQTKFEVHSHLPGHSPRCGRLKMVANLPYSVATPVLLGALESGLPFERLLVMVQHEVAEKLAARPGDREWGIPSLLRFQFADARIKRKVPGKVFWPRPKVDSALLELRPRADRPDIDGYHRLRRLAHLMFQHRRKSSGNSLALSLGIPPSQAAEWIAAAGGDPSSRTEQLKPEVLQHLADQPQIEPRVRMAMDQHEEQLAARAQKHARRAEWKHKLNKSTSAE
jgi:16S rRNA (adenine1518-N6/adenine1519-N6)-dimethyltransferase